MSATIHQLETRLASVSKPSGKGSDGGGMDNGGEPPDNGGMELRLQSIEGKLENLDKMLNQHFATKADVSNAKNSIIMWVVGAIIFAQVLPTILNALGK